MMDDDTIEEPLPEYDGLDTVQEQMVFDDDPTVLTSAAPPEDDEVSPWPNARTERRVQSMRGAVYSAVGTTRVA